MALVRLVDESELTGGPAEMAASGKAQYGMLLNTWRAIMNRPALFEAYLPFLRAVAGPGDLDGRLKDISALLVGRLNNCRYTVSHRAASARAKGVGDAEFEALAARDWSAFDERTRVALALTEQLTLNPTNVSYADLPQAVDAELIGRAQALFSDAELVELIMSISVWNSISRFHRVMGFDLDMPEPPESLDPAIHPFTPTQGD